MDHIEYLSAERLVQLKAELHDLKTVKRREAADRIEVAKALGDLSENAEYHEAKDAMALLENRIFEVDELLKNVRLIEDQGGASGTVHIGSTVTVEVHDKKKVFTIVGSNEADPLTGKISNESPIGQALLGHHVGETVEVTTPAGTHPYQIRGIA